MIKDAHDDREFRQYLSFKADGTVAATHEIAASVEPSTVLVEVTDLAPADLHGVTVKASLVTALTDAVAAIEAAKVAHETAKADLLDAVNVAVDTQKTGASTKSVEL